MSLTKDLRGFFRRLLHNRPDDRYLPTADQQAEIDEEVERRPPPPGQIVG
ncbi:MAG: hypothetical protein GY939_15300 [Actinomycetia bacterium]|nr:hypothetical protein [Actinomycetes bacterium]